MRRVLWLAYFFPPAGGAGVQRPLKFIKHLPRFGWQSTVVTAEDGCYFATDATLAAEIPANTPVWRTYSLEAERLPWLRARRARQSQAPTTEGRSPGGLTRLLQSARTQLLPDPQVGWLPFAYHRAAQLMAEHPFDALVSTSSPTSAHLVALLLHRRFGVPWLADFRDAWSDDPMGLLRHHSVHAALEAQVLRQADHVTAVTPGIIDFFAQRAPSQRYTVLPNGFDPSDFGVAPPPDPQPFILTFVGSLYGKISAVPFLTALAEVRRANPTWRCRVRFIGQMDHAAAAEYEAAVHHLGLADCTERTGYVPHPEAVAAMQAAHVLLLILYAGPNTAQVMSGKIFEYLAAGRPILALADHGVAADLVRRAQAGWVEHPNAVPNIACRLELLWRAHKAGGIPHTPDAAVIDAYSRVTLTSRLAELLAGLRR